MQNLYSLGVEVIGVIATITVLSGYLIRNPRTTMALGAVGMLFWALHFVLIGAVAGVANAITGLVRNFAGAWLADRWMHWVVAGVAAAVLATWLLTPEGPVALFILASALMKNFATLWRNHVYPFRFTQLLGEIITIPYALGIGSSALLASLAISIGIMSIGLLRLIWQDGIFATPKNTSIKTDNQSAPVAR